MTVSKELIEQCKDNDRLAQKALYKLCYPVLMAVCARYHRQEADAVHVLNEGFLKIVMNLDKHRPEVPFEAWIRRIMLNTVIDDFRKNKKYQQNTDLGVSEGLDRNNSAHAVSLNEGERELILKDMYRLIQQLPPMTNKVFNLHIIDGYSHAEIGEKLGMSEGTSKWHVSNARKLLQAAIQKLKEQEYVSS